MGKNTSQRKVKSKKEKVKTPAVFILQIKGKFINSKVCGANKEICFLKM